MTVMNTTNKQIMEPNGECADEGALHFFVSMLHSLFPVAMTTVTPR